MMLILEVRNVKKTYSPRSVSKERTFSLEGLVDAIQAVLRGNSRDATAEAQVHAT